MAVCCLEQGFPIAFPTPIITREVLMSGACLVGSTEGIRKLPSYGQLPHGFCFFKQKTAYDIERLGEQLAAIVKDPEPAAALGERGHRFARELQRDVTFPQTLERILEAAAQRVPAAVRGSADDPAGEAGNSCFPLTQLAAAAIRETAGAPPLRQTIDLARAREVLAAVEQGIRDGKTSL